MKNRLNDDIAFWHWARARQAKSGVSWSSYWSTHLFGEDTLDMRLTSRSGLTLVDSIGDNDASILLPCMKSTTTNSCNIQSGVTPTADTIWVFKARIDTLNTGTGVGTNESGARFQLNSIAGGRFQFAWGDSTENYTAMSFVDTNWYLFIIYDKRFWRVPATTALTDAAILNVIATVTPTLTATGASFGTSTRNIRYFNMVAGGAETPMTMALSFIGSISGGEITWQVKHILKDLNGIWNILSDTQASIVGNGLSIVYDANGATDLLDNGHSIYYKEGTGVLTIPYVNGSPFAGTAPAGYVKLKDCPGNTTRHNLAASKIRFPLGSVWDRSNTTIYADAARLGFYDASNPTDWHVTELNQLAMNETFFNSGQDCAFVHIETNSVDNDDREYINELFSYPTPVTGDDLNKVLQFNGDYIYFL